MIEKVILDFLNENLDPPVWMEVPKDRPTVTEYVLLEKTGSGRYDHLSSATFAVQSYAKSLYEAAQLNEEVKAVMDRLPELDEVSRSALNSDYNYTDIERAQYRYQAVYDIVHY